jgi:hypothetical protein
VLTQAATGARNEHASFWKKAQASSTIAIKLQIRKLMFEDLVEKVEAGARAQAIRGQPREEVRLFVQSG